MGSGASSGSRLYCRPEVDVSWYSFDSDQSLSVQQQPTGFGYFREKSFREGCTLGSEANRKGNENGELSGKIVFYNKAGKSTNYATKQENPTFDVDVDTKIFAKVFLGTPLGMSPIGQNNLRYKKHDKTKGAVNYRGFGPVLLAPIIRAVALFVVVDGTQQSYEIFCTKSAKAPDNQRRPLEPVDEQEDEQELDMIVTSPISGSFVTFPMAKSQAPFFFIHLPVLVDHEDCLKVNTGPYALTVASAFWRLFNSLSPGKHKINVLVQVYYDHTEFRYFVLDYDLNALGVWGDCVLNEYLNSPHPDPFAMTSPESTVGESCFTINVPANVKKMLDGLLDRKPPPERYTDDDINSVRREAGVVALGKFCKKFDVQGLPDITVLMTKKLALDAKEEKTGHKHEYDYVEFACCWLDPQDSSVHGHGIMLQGAMAKGEVEPKEYTQTWTWHDLTRNGKTVDTDAIDVKNKYILARMVQRRKSQTTIIEDIKKMKLSKM